MARASLRMTIGALILSTLLFTGCASPSGPAEEPAGPSESAKPAAITIGTLATQDSLPLWVAEDKGYYARAGLDDVEIVTFQSAQELQTAFVSGSVDALMTDIMVSANLQASGTEVVLPTVMLGATIPEGRFAVVAAPDTEIASMADLKDVPVGTASLTITEYVLDKLMEEAGVAESAVAKEEIDKMPVRFQLLMEGKLKAASLPEPFVSLAELQGATVVPGGDDTKAQNNISTTVLCVNREYAQTGEGAASVAALLEAWDAAVVDINADPDSFRQVLVDRARLPEPLAKSYVVSTYPTAQPPTAEMIQPVLDWMSAKGYLRSQVTPADLLP
ncbi:MAG: ABC transporter substrate-binding protein [Coriobacteriia bacterium]|jgi:NitT/TauT family transport system substrate-binding protein|nr:ABC transporter substrate-binding protein [Coriobacteriia bacterium]